MLCRTGCCEFYLIGSGKNCPTSNFLLQCLEKTVCPAVVLWAEHGATWEIEPTDEYWSQSVLTGLAFGKLPAFEFSPTLPSVGQLG